jgi:hypothetical protein
MALVFQGAPAPSRTATLFFGDTRSYPAKCAGNPFKSSPSTELNELLLTSPEAGLAARRENFSHFTLTL